MWRTQVCVCPDCDAPCFTCVVECDPPRVRRCNSMGLEIVGVVAVQRTRADHQWPRNPSLSKMGWDTKKPFSGVAWAENCFTCGYAAAHQ